MRYSMISSYIEILKSNLAHLNILSGRLIYCTDTDQMYYDSTNKTRDLIPYIIVKATDADIAKISNPSTDKIYFSRSTFTLSVYAGGMWIIVPDDVQFSQTSYYYSDQLPVSTTGTTVHDNIGLSDLLSDDNKALEILLNKLSINLQDITANGEIINLTNSINSILTILQSSDSSLDTFQELADYIKSNNVALNKIIAEKINTSDIINDFTHTDIDKPISANIANALKTLIDNVTKTVGPIGPTGPKGDDGIQGPIGLTGLKGEDGVNGTAGLDGSVWYNNGTSVVLNTIGKNGDYCINYQGDIYYKEFGEWVKITNIAGPQGVQGDKGDKGDKGDPADKPVYSTLQHIYNTDITVPNNNIIGLPFNYVVGNKELIVCLNGLIVDCIEVDNHTIKLDVDFSLTDQDQVSIYKPYNII